VALEGARFAYPMVSPPAQLSIVAIDAAGNRSVQFAPVVVKPRLPAEPVRGVHMTADSWANATLRKGVLAMIAAHEINTVELDGKDEGGVVGFDPDTPWARKIGASQPIYDLRAAVRQLHGLGIRVIARLVCFRDPIAAAAAWQEGKRDMVVQSPD